MSILFQLVSIEDYSVFLKTMHYVYQMVHPEKLFIEEVYF